MGSQLAAADFDQDGYTDLAVLNGDPNNPNIAIYQNTGSQAGDTGIQFTTPSDDHRHPQRRLCEQLQHRLARLEPVTVDRLPCYRHGHPRHLRRV